MNIQSKHMLRTLSFWKGNPCVLNMEVLYLGLYDCMTAWLYDCGHLRHVRQVRQLRRHVRHVPHVTQRERNGPANRTSGPAPAGYFPLCDMWKTSNMSSILSNLSNMSKMSTVIQSCSHTGIQSYSPTLLRLRLQLLLLLGNRWFLKSHYPYPVNLVLPSPKILL